MVVSTNAPQFQTGDFIEFRSHPAVRGMVISVQRSNFDERFSTVYPYVFYVLSSSPTQKIDGPYFASQICNVHAH